MSEDSYKPEKKEGMMQDSYTEKISNGTLKVYIDMTDTKLCEQKLKNFRKIARFIMAIKHAK